jgi:hypothetical protein
VLGHVGIGAGDDEPSPNDARRWSRPSGR